MDIFNRISLNRSTWEQNHMIICIIDYKWMSVWQKQNCKNLRENSMDKTDAKVAMEELTMMLIYLSHFTEQDKFANKNDKYA